MDACRKDWLPYYLALLHLNCQSPPFGDWTAGISDILNTLTGFKVGQDANHLNNPFVFTNGGEGFFDQFKAFQDSYAQQFLSYSKGLQAYFEAPFLHFEDLGQNVWDAQGVHIYDSNPQSDGHPVLIFAPLLLDPHLFHFPTHLDFLNYLKAQGLRPLIMDVYAKETLQHETSFDVFCRQTLFPAYGFLLGYLPELPSILAFWESSLWLYALFQKRFPLRGGCLVGEPPPLSPQEMVALGQVWQNGFLTPTLDSGQAVDASFVRFFFSLSDPLKVIHKMTDLGKKASLAPDFLGIEDLLNQPRSLPPWLGKFLLSDQMWPSSQELKAFLKHFPPILSESTTSQPLLKGGREAGGLILPVGNYGLMFQTAAPSNAWQGIVKRIKDRLKQK